ncbi:MAG: 3-methyl-2-oxobutanoate hydroxymethyltransferase [Ignavibacteria bacterium]|jgi:3-methyl-2-oxobutanoate hydroxymethyltransferase
MVSVNEFKKYKKENRKISVITCYDFTSAKIVNETDVDCVLIGDSAAMVMHGYETTVNANLEMMCYHVSAVAKGATNKFLIADLPFLQHRRGIDRLIDSVDKLMKCGANSVKIEGAGDNVKVIEYVVNSGVPVMGHLGLTPQSIYQLGGYKIQGKNGDENKLIDAAKSLENAGCFAIVLELISSEVAKRITEAISIPTIGIGAGQYTSGQVLVFQDMLGCNMGFEPKFLRKYLNGYELIRDAINNYNSDVKKNDYPSQEESY